MVHLHRTSRNASSANEYRTVWVAALILGRDVGLGIAAIYYRWISLPPPKTFTRYWDFSLPSAEVRPTTISKYNTFLQLALVGTTTAAPLVGADMTSMLSALQYDFPVLDSCSPRPARAQHELCLQQLTR